MDGFFELALESAEAAGHSSSVKEKAVTRHVDLLSFCAKLPFGERDSLRSEGEYHTLVMRQDPLSDLALQAELSFAVAKVLSLFKIKRAKNLG